MLDMTAMNCVEWAGAGLIMYFKLILIYYMRQFTVFELGETKQPLPRFL